MHCIYLTLTNSKWSLMICWRLHKATQTLSRISPFLFLFSPLHSINRHFRMNLRDRNRDCGCVFLSGSWAADASQPEETVCPGPVLQSQEGKISPPVLDYYIICAALVLLSAPSLISFPPLWYNITRAPSPLNLSVYLRQRRRRRWRLSCPTFRSLHLICTVIKF